MSIQASDLTEHKAWNAWGRYWMYACWKNGKQEGCYKYVLEDGQLWESGYRREGKLQGERKSWYRNGQLYAREFYSNGILEGNRKTWSLYGEPTRREFYRNGLWEGEHIYYADKRLGCHGFHRKGVLIDSQFTFRKKQNILHLRRRFLISRIYNTCRSILIPDLSGIVTSFIPS